MSAHGRCNWTKLGYDRKCAIRGRAIGENGDTHSPLEHHDFAYEKRALWPCQSGMCGEKGTCLGKQPLTNKQANTQSNKHARVQPQAYKQTSKRTSKQSSKHTKRKQGSHQAKQQTSRCQRLCRAPCSFCGIVSKHAALPVARFAVFRPSCKSCRACETRFFAAPHSQVCDTRGVLQVFTSVTDLILLAARSAFYTATGPL